MGQGYYFSINEQLLLSTTCNTYTNDYKGHMGPQSLSVQPPYPTFKIFSALLMLTVKKYHYNGNPLISIVQKISNSSFLLASSSIFIRTLCFHLDDSPDLTHHT